MTVWERKKGGFTERAPPTGGTKAQKSTGIRAVPCSNQNDAWHMVGAQEIVAD